MIARRPVVGLLVALLAASVVAACSDSGQPTPAAEPTAVTPSLPVPVPAVGTPIVPKETASTSRGAPRSTPRTSGSRTSRPTTPRRTAILPDSDAGRALFRCLDGGKTYDECVN